MSAARSQLARLTAPPVQEIGVQAMGQRYARYGGACLGAFARDLRLKFVAVTTPGGEFGVFHGVHSSSWWTPSSSCSVTDAICVARALTERQPSGNDEFDQLCLALGIKHRLPRPRTPRANAMVERFNGRIADVLKTHRFNSALDLEHTLLRYVALYNHQLPQSALKSKTPLQAMKDWCDSHPHLFWKHPYDRSGFDTWNHCPCPEKCPVANE